MLPVDVKTRQNSLYLIMLEAMLNKGAIIQFINKHPSLALLKPTEKEQKDCVKVEKALQPFYNYTLTISYLKPSPNETCNIMQGLNNLYDNIEKRNGLYANMPEFIRSAFQAGAKKL